MPVDLLKTTLSCEIYLCEVVIYRKLIDVRSSDILFLVDIGYAN